MYLLHVFRKLSDMRKRLLDGGGQTDAVELDVQQDSCKNSSEHLNNKEFREAMNEMRTHFASLNRQRTQSFSIKHIVKEPGFVSKCVGYSFLIVLILVGLLTASKVQDSVSEIRVALQLSQTESDRLKTELSGSKQELANVVKEFGASKQDLIEANSNIKQMRQELAEYSGSNLLKQASAEFNATIAVRDDLRSNYSQAIQTHLSMQETISETSQSVTQVESFVGFVPPPHAPSEFHQYRNAVDSVQFADRAGATKARQLRSIEVGSNSWVGGVLSLDGRIFGIPSNSASVLIVDPATNTADTTTIAGLESGGYKWRGGVLSLDGRIFGIPHASTSVLVLSCGQECDAYAGKPSAPSFFVSPFVNKF